MNVFMALTTDGPQIEQLFLPDPFIGSRPAIPWVTQMMNLPRTPTTAALAHIIRSL
jgi:hypothetical protein